MRQTRKRIRHLTIIATCAAAASGVTCLQSLFPCSEETMVTVRLINDSTSQYVAPNLGFCPLGMATQPHFFVASPPVLGPGEEATYTSCELAGVYGNCQTYNSDFMTGLCGWAYGTNQEQLSQTIRRFGGQIGAQFNCGDTIILRWTEAGEAGGTWTSEVEPATGNPQPQTPFQAL